MLDLDINSRPWKVPFPLRVMMLWSTLSVDYWAKGLCAGTETLVQLSGITAHSLNLFSSSDDTESPSLDEYVISHFDPNAFSNWTPNAHWIGQRIIFARQLVWNTVQSLFVSTYQRLTFSRAFGEVQLFFLKSSQYLKFRNLLDITNLILESLWSQIYNLRSCLDDAFLCHILLFPHFSYNIVGKFFEAHNI